MKARWQRVRSVAAFEEMGIPGAEHITNAGGSHGGAQLPEFRTCTPHLACCPCSRPDVKHPLRLSR